MAYLLEIRDDALHDIAESYKWYEEKLQGLGARFVEEVEATIQYISKHPEHFQVKLQNYYREAILKVFPYVIVYELLENEKTVVVYAVFHTRGNPDKKLSNSE